MNLDTYFKVFSDCIPVRGTSRSIICDLRRYNFDFIPNILCQILLEDTNKTLIEIITKYGVANKDVIIEYFVFLLEKEYVFLCKKEELELFPELKMDWLSPCKIESAILDLANQDREQLISILKQLDTLACVSLQIRCFKDYSIVELETLLNLLDGSRIKNIELFLNYQKEIDLTSLKANKRVCTITVFNAFENKTLKDDGHCKVVYTIENISNHKSCGQIFPSYFSMGIPMFTESQQHNTCLNRKISIDSEGYIKNCPSMSPSFGHISDTSLEDVLANPEFTKWWFVKKDDIDKCKSCEFRHICTDCRAYLENPEDMYSAPLKCGYNPEIGEWEDWSTNPLKQQAIQYYELDPILENSQFVK